MLTGETQVTAMNGKAFVFIVINLNQPHHYTWHIISVYLLRLQDHQHIKPPVAAV